MADKWIRSDLAHAVQLNPAVHLQNGVSYPFVDMQTVDPSIRSVRSSYSRPFTGGGSRFQSGDTLMARITPCLENGKIARFLGPRDNSMAHGSTEFIVVRGKDRITLNDFAYYLMQSDYVRRYAVSQMIGTSGRQRVPIRALENLVVSIPPILEQRAIGHILGTLDDKIELNHRMRETLESMARTLFQSWFVDFDPVHAKAEERSSGLSAAVDALFPSSFQESELGQVPDGWSSATLAKLVLLNSETWSRATYPEVVNYVDLSNAKWGHLESIVPYEKADAPSRAQRVLRRGDSIVGMVRPGNGSYALVADDGLTGSTGFAVLRPHKKTYRDFVYLAATNPENIDRLAHLADGGAYPAVLPNTVIATHIVCPSDAVMSSFSHLVAPMFDRVAACDRESRTLASLRDTLLPKLLSGELRVKDAKHFTQERAL